MFGGLGPWQTAAVLVPTAPSSTARALAALCASAIVAASGCGPPPRAPATGRPVATVVTFQHAMGGGFAPVELAVSIDGVSVADCPEVGSPLDARAPVFLGERTLASGTHVVKARVVLRGEGFGIFAYMRKYRFKIAEEKEIVIPDAHSFALRIETRERGGVTTPIEDRPFLTFTGQRDPAQSDGAPGCPRSRAEATVAAPE